MTRRNIPLFVCAAVLAAPLSLHADSPVYLPGPMQLHVPVIDLAEQQGAYHDAVLEFAEGDLWRLQQISIGAEMPGVEKVRVIQTSSFPVQVLLEVDGWLSGCGKSHIGQRRVDDTFEVSLQWVYPSGPPIIACPAVVSRFSWVVPLPVYGLAAGEYHYRVNGGARRLAAPEDGSDSLSGSFVLAADNILPRVAPEYPRVISPMIVVPQRIEPAP